MGGSNDVCLFVRNLRVHSFRGMLELMWMLSIQMCPLVPCTKKPSITTYHRENRGGRGRGSVRNHRASSKRAASSSSTSEPAQAPCRTFDRLRPAEPHRHPHLEQAASLSTLITDNGVELQTVSRSLNVVQESSGEPV